MKPFAAAAALLFVTVQPASAEPAAPAAATAPSEALVDRFIAVIPDRDQIDSVSTEIDAGELAALVALNPGKEAQIRPILQANLACTGPAISAGSLRMLRTVARNLGEEKLKRLIAFYEGPDYAAFAALAARMEGKDKPSAEDSAAMAKMMGAYPLQAFHAQLNSAPEIIGADQGFMEAAMRCATEQVAALDKAGLKAN